MASISSVKICNMAISHVGDDSTIESLSESSAEAAACSIWYDWSRIQTLEGHNWDFAIKRATLALLETNPTEDWAYRYNYPTDCVKARLIVNPLGRAADPVPFTVEASSDGQVTTILTDQENAKLIYTMDVEDPTRFSSMFIDALSWRVASRIAFSLTGKREIVRDSETIAAQHLNAAQNSNANEGMGDKPREAPWIEARS